MFKIEAHCAQQKEKSSGTQIQHILLLKGKLSFFRLVIQVA